MSGGVSLRQVGRKLLDTINSHPYRTFLIGISLVLAYIIWRILGVKTQTESYLDIFGLWLLCIGSFLMAFTPPNLFIELRRLWQSRIPLVPLLIILVALTARTLWLATLPADPHLDEITHPYVGWLMLQGKYTNMFATWQSFGTLYAYLLALPVWLFEASPVASRIAPAIAGVLGTVFIYLLGSRLFDRNTGLFAALILAVSHYHVHFSRSGFGLFVIDATFVTVILGLIYYGLHTRRLLAFALGGVLTGVSIYSYVGARAIPLILGFYLFLLLLTERDFLRNYGLALLILTAGFVITVIPLAFWANLRPNEFWMSANAESVFGSSSWLRNEAQRLQTAEWLIIADMVRQAFLTINYYPLELFYGARMPMLDWVSSALFFLGVGLLLRNLFDRRYLLIFSWILVPFVVGGGLVLSPSISGYRLLVAFPAICLLVGMSLSRLVGLGSSVGSYGRRLAWLLTTVLLSVSVILNLKAYFVDYGPIAYWGPLASPQNLNALTAIRAFRFTGSLGDDHVVYFLGRPGLDAKTYWPMPYLAWDTEVVDQREPLKADFTVANPSKKAVFIALPERSTDLQFVMQRFPGGVMEENRRGSILLYTVYRAP